MISSAGEYGQFRTPRHIIDLIVRLMNPGAQDTICDLAAGTAGFLDDGGYPRIVRRHLLDQRP